MRPPRYPFAHRLVGPDHNPLHVGLFVGVALKRHRGSCPGAARQGSRGARAHPGDRATHRAFPVPLTLARDVERWPFDTYYTEPITVELFSGAQAPERANVTFVDRLTGWKVDVSRVNRANPLSPYVVELQRSASTMLFAIVILVIFVAIAAVGLFVAVKTIRDPRRFQSPLTTWYAAMLFAVVPLRNARPGSPAFGSWIDLTIVLWVLVALVVSMLLYIASWWRATTQA
nr:DUF4436 family protein [Mycobacterium shigaense]